MEDDLAREAIAAKREYSKAITHQATSGVVSSFFGAGFLWLIFGSVFLAIFVKLSQSIPFALVIGLVFVAIIIWRGTGR